MIKNSFVNHFGFIYLVKLYISLLQFWEVCVMVMLWAFALALFAMLVMLSNIFCISSGS